MAAINFTTTSFSIPKLSSVARDVSIPDFTAKSNQATIPALTKRVLKRTAQKMSETGSCLTLTDQLRGMILFSAYGDAMGANHEVKRCIHPAPFPNRLPQQQLIAEPDRWGYWLTSDHLTGLAKGIPTDDTSFKLFILHPWLQHVLEYDSQINETSFREFIVTLKSRPSKPDWIFRPRNAQIDSWLDMYDGVELSEKREFFETGTPVVFGIFLFLEIAAIRTGFDPIANYRFFRTATVLDQHYANTATAFLAAIVSLAFSGESAQRFDKWFLQQSLELTEKLNRERLDCDDIRVIQNIIETMWELGRNVRHQSPQQFMIVFEQTVIQPSHPPFMETPFVNPLHDPFRMLAEIYAAVAYAEGDPFRTIQPLAFGSGDSDTVCTFLGTLIGARFGYKSLHEHSDLTEDLETIESVLKDILEIDLNKHVEIFLKLHTKNQHPTA